MKSNPLMLLAIVCLSACFQGAQSTDNTQSLSTDQTSNQVAAQPSGTAAAAGSQPDGLVLPIGFHAQVFAEGVGSARHMVSRPNGDTYVRLEEAKDGKSLVALRDANGDGKAEKIAYFGGGEGGSGLAIDDKYLYYSTGTEVFRQALPTGDALVPTAAPERIVTNLGSEGMHNARSLALDGQGHLYVNVGAPSNSCQEIDRAPNSLGKNPCPYLQNYAGIWRFDANKKDQDKIKDGFHYASGIRNAVALEWNKAQNKLYLLQHGRDQLFESFGKYYSQKQGAELPSEEFVDIAQGDNLGWPYCYHDPEKNSLMQAPEYGGDGKKTGNCASFKAPLVGFPAHYAPNDLFFYTGKMFGPEYSGGAFIAFHGSWNRGSQQAGFDVVFQPLQNGKPSGKWTSFAQNFAGRALVTSPAQAKYRPMGLAQRPDGSLLIIDSNKGRIWRISK